MNKTVKYILYGVGTFAFIILATSLIRSLIRSVPFADAFKDWTNWLIAAICGVCSALSLYKKDQEKEKKDKE